MLFPCLIGFARIFRQIRLRATFSYRCRQFRTNAVLYKRTAMLYDIPMKPKTLEELNIQRRHTCCFTGHRSIEVGNDFEPRLIEFINLLYTKYGVDTFVAGGAMGFDTMAATAVLRAKKVHNIPIRLLLILPCPNQGERYSLYDRFFYDLAKVRADYIEYVSDHYYNGCMHRRNRRMVELSALCVCYLTQDTGGTKYTVDYATKCGLKVINLAKARGGV